MMFNWLSHHILHQHFSICLISSWIRLQSHSQIWLLFSSRPDKVDSYQLEVSNVFADQFEHLSEDQPGVCDSPQCSAGGQGLPVSQQELSQKPEPSHQSVGNILTNTLLFSSSQWYLFLNRVDSDYELHIAALVDILGSCYDSTWLVNNYWLKLFSVLWLYHFIRGYTFISYQYLVMTVFGYLTSHDIIILFDCMFPKFYKSTPSLLKRTLITDISGRRHTLNYKRVEYFLKIQRMFYRFIYSVCQCCNKPKYHSVDYVHNYKVHE